MNKVYLIPAPLDVSQNDQYFAPIVKSTLSTIPLFWVENIRSARRFLSSLQLDLNIDNLHFEVLEKSVSISDFSERMKPYFQYDAMGIIAEAGLPCLADPGNVGVAWAHLNHLQVIPLPGASAVILALISSGFNGQQFTFHGYLPIEKIPLKEKILSLESEVLKTHYTQIFIETPYRNQRLFDLIINTCKDDTLLSIASGIFSTQSKIATHTRAYWKNHPPSLQKVPTVFCLGVMKQKGVSCYKFAKKN